MAAPGSGTSGSLIDSKKIIAAWPKQVGVWALTRQDSTGADDPNHGGEYGQNNKQQIILQYSKIQTVDSGREELVSQMREVAGGVCGEKATKGSFICYLPADTGVVLASGDDLDVTLDQLVDFARGLPAAIGTV